MAKKQDIVQEQREEDVTAEQGACKDNGASRRPSGPQQPCLESDQERISGAECRD